jgi:hypothetical protein
MTIPVLPLIKRGGCAALTVNLEPTRTLEVEFRTKTLRVDLSAQKVLEVSICWPPVHFDYVVHEGTPVMHDGEYVFVLVPD